MSGHLQEAIKRTPILTCMRLVNSTRRWSGFIDVSAKMI